MWADVKGGRWCLLGRDGLEGSRSRAMLRVVEKDLLLYHSCGSSGQVTAGKRCPAVQEFKCHTPQFLN